MLPDEYKETRTWDKGTRARSSGLKHAQRFTAQGQNTDRGLEAEGASVSRIAIKHERRVFLFQPHS